MKNGQTQNSDKIYSILDQLKAVEISVIETEINVLRKITENQIRENTKAAGYTPEQAIKDVRKFREFGVSIFGTLPTGDCSGQTNGGNFIGETPSGD